MNSSAGSQPVFGVEMKGEGSKFRLTEVKILPSYSAGQPTLPAGLQGGPGGLQRSLPTKVFIES